MSSIYFHSSRWLLHKRTRDTIYSIVYPSGGTVRSLSTAQTNSDIAEVVLICYAFIYCNLTCCSPLFSPLVVWCINRFFVVVFSSVDPIISSSLFVFKSGTDKKILPYFIYNWIFCMQIFKLFRRFLIERERRDDNRTWQYAQFMFFPFIFHYCWKPSNQTSQWISRYC